jgi:hypothetical protein
MTRSLMVTAAAAHQSARLPRAATWRARRSGPQPRSTEVSWPPFPRCRGGTALPCCENRRHVRRPCRLDNALRESDHARQVRCIPRHARDSAPNAHSQYRCREATQSLRGARRLLQRRRSSPGAGSTGAILDEAAIVPIDVFWAFLLSLPTAGNAPRKWPGCSELSINPSVYCARHHYMQMQGEPPPED